ncbi:MAG TPA: 2-oxoglutarate dehydrogenase complex dihydrolipoyllysine-residue succinyltransferase [Gemmatimonadaceae bacterium]|nr:2-oxoglutarate dehydrogenase complex dihydrolipoyllysine-residue succinyltransferase [Gemmatimonadaceae bacterium]
MPSIKVPVLGESIVEATISRWLKKEGDRVNAGETLVELETDKVTVEVPALKAGVVVRRLKGEGDVVKVDEVLGEIDESGAGAVAAAPAPVAAPVPAAATPPVAPPVAQAPAWFSAPAAPATPGGGDKVSPAARRIAAEGGIDLASVSGTGRGGVISKPDVIEHIAAAAATPPVLGSPAATPASAPAQAPAPAAPAAPAPTAAPAAAPAPASASRVEAPQPVAAPMRPPVAGAPRESREKMSTRRRRIAEHLLEAQHATAHLTTFNEIDLTAVESLRGRIKDKIEKEHGVRLSMMPFFVKAACLALKQYPVVNAKVDGDHIQYHHYVNMGIAVASDAGLVVPNLKDADRMSLLDIARAIVAVAKKARDGKLTMDDLTGGTFTITNGGVFGSLISTPIINYPQVGILGLHKVQDRPMVVNGEIAIRPMMYVALSYDHRIIDGQQAVLFLVKVKELMEDPALMVVE